MTANVVQPTIKKLASLSMGSASFLSLHSRFIWIRPPGTRNIDTMLLSSNESLTKHATHNARSRWSTSPTEEICVKSVIETPTFFDLPHSSPGHAKLSSDQVARSYTLRRRKLKEDKVKKNRKNA